ncbi:lysylphosphatidylglycerol synthase domain-containing protein [Phenylobacterium sp.]|uniref:lysylphosphatidylglycerol synthase domain-containing protein n=1 Tax=Phenylobacterium sp. TaxID=1871053 RepID=UPI00301D8B82
MLTQDPQIRPGERPDDLEEELAAALPETQGSRFFPMLRRLAWHLLAFLLLAAAAYILWREFHEIRLSDVTAAIRAWGWDSTILAILFSAFSFALMGLVEWMGMRWVGSKVPPGQAFAGGFIACALSHSLGANLLVSGAVRARFYAKHNVPLRQVAAITLFNSFTFTVGLSFLAGFSLILAGRNDIATVSRIATPVADSLGALLLLGVASYLVLCGVLHRPIRAFGHTVRLPSLKMAFTQLGIGTVDNAMAAAIIWVLLPDGAVSYFTFVGAYAPSVAIGLISHVPGGVGVFEGTLSTLLRGINPAGLAAAFLGYRLFFFLIPLLIAGLALAADTVQERTRRKAA